MDFSYLYTGYTPNQRTADGQVAIVTINGPLEFHASWMWDSYESIFERTFHEIVPQTPEFETDVETDEEPLPPPKAIIFKLDSPGGEAAGAGACSRKLRKLSAQSGIPFYAFSNESSASAAYELSVACQEIWLCQEACVGSVGVVATLFDRTVQNAKIGLGIELITSGKFKADGHPDRPITDGLRARIQSRVDLLAHHFFELVAESRDTTVKSVADLEAAVFYGLDAVDAGLADGVIDFDSFVDMVSRTITS